MADTVAVIGLGLIGGSIARDLSALGGRVLGWDIDGAAVAAARSAGVLAAELDGDLAGAADADTIVIAVPVGAAAGVLSRLPPLPPHAVVTDAGSTKRGILAAAEAAGLGATFVGAHPLAGDHHGGWVASRTGLFQGARVFLCPGASTARAALQRARAFWEGIGAEPVVTSAAVHDRLMARVSHLPQLAASALAHVLAHESVRRAELGAGGRDTLRLAGSPAGIWTDIALENRDQLLPLLASLRAELAGLEDALQSEQRAGVRDFFESAAAWANQDG